MRERKVSRRRFLKSGLTAAAVGPWVLGRSRMAEAGPEEERIIQAAKS